jgi:serine/threonine-protein kinase
LPKPGDLVCGKYRVIRCIKTGGQGAIYEAIQMHLDRRVALKVIHRSPEGSASDSQDSQAQADRERFVREAKALARLSHRNIAQIFDFDMSIDGEFCLVMEFLDGRDLRRELTKRGTLRVQEALGYLMQACAGVDEAHRHGIVHRDIKPHNLFLTNLGGERVVKLVDFGLAKTHADTSVTAHDVQPGTPQYMAPELYEGAEADARSDIWALGTVLYELLTGSSPFRREGGAATMFAVMNDSPRPISEVRSDIPRALDGLIARCLAKRPDDRFQKVSELSAALELFGPPSGAVHLSFPPVRGSSSPPAPDPSMPLPSDVLLASTVSAVTNSSHGSNTGETVLEPQPSRLRNRRPFIYALVGGAAATAVSFMLLRPSGNQAEAVPSVQAVSIAAARPEPAPALDSSTAPALDLATAAPAASAPAAASSSAATRRSRPAPKTSVKRPGSPDRLPLHL